jgi:hypothetical protein
LYGAEFAIFLFDKEEWCRVRAFRWFNVAFLRLFFNEGGEGLSFGLREGIDFAR